MKLTNLKPGTKLMWDAPLPFDGYLGKHDPERIIYPAIVVDAAAPNDYLKRCVKIKTGHAKNWIGPDCDNLRLPTDTELETLTWPSID